MGVNNVDRILFYKQKYFYFRDLNRKKNKIKCGKNLEFINN